jgi:tRNA nucleotidyltransferase (CCA-adding enzyme)
VTRWVLPGSAEHARRAAAAKLRAHAWPAELLAALARLSADGHRALLVGGSVRDVILGRTADARWDVATDRLPEAVRTLFERTLGVGERHGTVLVLWQGLAIECTTFRREGEYADARHPDQVWFTHDPLEDLARRDFTVNALAYEPTSGELLDPFEGARDLKRRRLRAVGEPIERFREDALRALRAARLAAVLALELDEDTRAALGGVRDRMAGLAAERVREELEKLMAAPRPSVGYEILREAGLLELWLPELVACRGVPQNRFHAYDVYFHSLYSCDAARADQSIVRWAALLHDIGKPGTRAERAGDGTFYGHAELGARLADALLARLRFAHTTRERVVHLIREHMFDYQPEWSDAAVRRFVRRVGREHVAELFDLRIADALGNGTRDPDTRRLETMARRINRVLADATALSVRDLAVDGDTVMHALGLPSGPEVGRVLERLLEEVLDDPALNTRERLLARLGALRDPGGRP